MAYCMDLSMPLLRLQPRVMRVGSYHLLGWRDGCIGVVTVDLSALRALQVIVGVAAFGRRSC